MPGGMGSWIKTEKQIWQVNLEEMSWGLGLPKKLEKPLPVSLLNNTNSILHWEYFIGLNLYQRQ
jgi:hypothetical protein